MLDSLGSHCLGSLWAGSSLHGCRCGVMQHTALLCSMARAQQSHQGLLPFTNAMALPGTVCVGCLSSDVLVSAAPPECWPYRLCLFLEISMTTWACTSSCSLAVC